MPTKVTSVLVSIFAFSTSAYSQANECTAGESTSVSLIVAETAASCCTKNKPAKRRRCINKAVKALKRAKTIISPELNNSAKASLRDLISAQCDTSAMVIPACTADTSTTTDEALNNVSELACGLQYTDQRKSKLKAQRRFNNRAKKSTGAAFAATVKDGINALLQSEACGKGGEKRSNGCKNVKNPRDGAIVGNVYKLSDIPPHNPVFITHNGSRPGLALSKDGKTLDRLRYTGLGNGDVRGLRHHFRFNKSCRTFPKGFLIKLGSTCYEINTPCGRID